MKCLLIFPPFFYLPMLYPSIFYIKGFLKSHDIHDVQAVDFNVRFYDYVYGHSREIVSRLNERLKRTNESEDPLYEERKAILLRAPAAEKLKDRALRYFRRESVKKEEYDTSQKLMCALNSILDAYGALGAMDYDESTERYCSENVMKYVSSVDFPYRDFYDHEFSRLAKVGPPDFVGISLVFEHQLLHAFAVARWTREYFPKAHVCLGGTTITKIVRSPRFRSRTRKNIFKFVDSVIEREAEHSILELLKYVEDKSRHFPDYVNIVFSDQTISAMRPSPYREMFAPDYDGLEYDKYFNMTFLGGRQKQVPFLASRGCYWRKCRFCASHYIYSGVNQCRDLKSLISTIDRYQKKYGFKFVRFNDEAMTPALIRSLSREILKRKIKLVWATNIRIDRYLDKDACDQLYRAGCRKLLLGAESGSQAVLDAMDKGILLKDTERLLPLLSASGLAPHLYILCHYPGETLKDIKRTFDFLKRNRRYINSLAISSFDGEILSPIYGLLDRSDIELPAARFDFFPIFYMEKGPTKKMREVYSQMMKFNWDLIRERQYG